ncbi:MAG: hypothetical protein KKF56_04925 [Nanoarchaeota archaeon]|nr:hypothetical protein [Nanoarchaeota archaeon]
MVKAKTKDIKIDFETEVKEIDISKLRLDLDNVRFQHLRKLLTDKEMENLLWGEKSTKDLYNQIKLAKGLYEEPIVDSNFVVLEGNRRLVCLRRLKQEIDGGKISEIKKGIFDKIKCRVIPEHISELDKELLLATLHVKGKKEWPAFNKAKQIHTLYTNYDISYQNLSKYLGMGKVTVIRMVEAYKKTQEYGLKYSEEKNWHKRYTYFDEFYRRQDLKEFREIKKNVDKFSAWVHENKFTNHRDVRLLRQVLDDEDARNALEIYNFEKALKILEQKNPGLNDKDFKQIQKTIKVVNSFSRKALIGIVNDTSKIAVIQKLKKEIDSFLKDIKSLEKR